MKTETSRTEQSDLPADDPESIVTELTFRKIARESIKVGYREGADEAKQQNFQEYFDRGFEEGFRNGFNIGNLKAQEKLGCSKSVGAPIKNELSTSRRGMCIICKETQTAQAPIENLVQKQRRVVEDFVEQNKTM